MPRSHPMLPPSGSTRRARRPRIVESSNARAGSQGADAGRQPGQGHGSHAASTSRRESNQEFASILRGHVTPALKGWLLWDGEFVMGPRYIRLLEGIERHGSIRAACADLGLSYRTCLTRIRRMERVTGASIVITQRGGSARGGAEVTPLGRRLVRAYRMWRDELERASRRAFARAIRD